MAVSEAVLVEAGVQAGLVDAGFISELKLKARRERIRLLEAVTRDGRFPEAALYQALAELRGMPFLQPHDLKPDRELLDRLPRNLMQRRLVLPVKGSGGEQLLALADPDDQISLDSASRATGVKFSPALADRGALAAVIRRIGQDGQPLGEVVAASSESDAVKLFDDIMKEAYLRRASDVHFEPFDGEMRVRLRVDGSLQEYSRPLSQPEGESLMTRLKVLSGLDIAEQRMPQDGGLSYRMEHWAVPPADIRVATVPTHWGERATLRLLGQETGQLSLEKLGMPKHILEAFRQAIARPFGMILVTGPTGSGKSTTLYAALREMDAVGHNILTVEDPVEQVMPGITQVKVTGKVDFAQALRSFLRHDPDVILVGEIRDKETVDTGLRAAMTGHMVLSTLHTNDAVGAVTRLEDIGAERYLIGSTLIGVLAQRLVRRLCDHCREAHAAASDELRLLGLKEEEQVEIFSPNGCPLCLGTGFLGRIGLFEALWIDDKLSAAIAEGAGEAQLRSGAQGLKTLWQDSCAKVLAGDTSLSEVLYLRPDAGVN